MGLRRRFDDNTHTAGLLTRIGMKYIGIKAQGRGILACIHLNRDHHIQGLAYQCSTTHATQRERFTAESDTN
ncbi:MAG: hypothetical protein ABI606_21200 [Rhodoferax sp.]